MSREFATSEIIRQKCSICGSKNKLYTEITFKGIHYGYYLTCCNCGHVDTFIEDQNGPSGMLDALFHRGREICIQNTTCTHKDCKYHGKSSLWNAKTTLDEAYNNQNGIENPINQNVGYAGCGCPICNPCAIANEKSDKLQLDINDCNSSNPRFH